MSTKSATATAAITILGLTPLAAAVVGGTLEFEDLTPGDSFQDGTASDPFVTDGITVNLEFFNFSGSGGSSNGTAFVDNPNPAGAGNGLFVSNTNLDFQFPFPLTTVGFSYDNGGGNVNLMINGALFNDNIMFNADGMTIGGADVTVTPFTARGIDAGVVTIVGNITQFAVGGQEFALDDVRYVPTPGALALLGLGGIAATRRRRRD